MVKSLFSLSAILLCLSFLNLDETVKLEATDQYKVIKVDGKIIFQKTNTAMKQGDVFTPDTPIEFTTPQSRAAVISSLKGRFVLTPGNSGETNILPAANNVTSRSGSMNNLVALQRQFSGRLLILGEMRLKIGVDAFPMNDDNFFYLSYFHNDEQIDKKLSFQNEFLILNKDEIFKVDGQPIEVTEKEMTIYYKKVTGATRVGKFTPVFPDLVSLKTEVDIILSEFSDKDNSEKISEIKGYLNEFYAKPERDNVEGWLKAEFNLE